MNSRSGCPCLGRRLAPWLLLGVLPILRSAAAAEGDLTLDEQRQQLASMSAEEKRELQRNQERFKALPPEERQRLRELHGQLAHDADSEPLWHVLEGYTRWLKTLSSGQRADLLNLPPAERIAKIKQLLQQQESARLRGLITSELSDQDVKAIAQWMDDLVERRMPQLLAEMPMLRERLQGTEDRSRKRVLVMMALRNLPRKDLLQPSPQEIEDLKSRLSASARQQLEAAEKKGEGADFARRFVRAAMLSRRFVPPVDKEKLRQFYEESLPSQKREELESMPPERMRAELTRLYMEHRFRQRGDADQPPFDRTRDTGKRPFGPFRRPADWKPMPDRERPKSPADRPRLFPKTDKPTTPPQPAD